MKINLNLQNYNYSNGNFKGKLSPKVTKLINDCAKTNAKKYVLLSSEKGQAAEQKELLKIKEKWDTVQNELIEKAKLLHAETEMIVESDGEPMCCAGRNYFLFRNPKLNVDYSATLVYLAEIYSTKCHLLTDEKFKKRIDFEPEKINKKLLEKAIDEVEKSAYYGYLESCVKQVEAIIEYLRGLSIERTSPTLEHMIATPRSLVENIPISLKKRLEDLIILAEKNYYENKTKDQLNKQGLKDINILFGPDK